MRVEIKKVQLMEGEEMMDLAKKVMGALVQQKGNLRRSLVLRGIYEDHIIAKDQESGRHFRMDLKRGDSGSIELSSMVEVRSAGWVPVSQKAEEEGKAVWTAAYVNRLPDSSFLYVAPGGKKDADGRTVPRSLRYFPVKDDQGKVDLPHLRNALARIPQADIPPAAKDAARRKAQQMLEEANKGEVKKSEDEVMSRVLVEGMRVDVQCDPEAVVALLKSIGGEAETVELSGSLWTSVLSS